MLNFDDNMQSDGKKLELAKINQPENPPNTISIKDIEVTLSYF